MGVVAFTKAESHARIIQNAVVVALEARSLCYGDASPELEAALRERAIEIWKHNRSIRTVPLATELLTWLNGKGEHGAQRQARRRRPSSSSNV